MSDLIELAGLSSGTENYKPLRKSQINKSAKFVSDVINVSENEYLNPFSRTLDGGDLLNLSSGVAF